MGRNLSLCRRCYRYFQATVLSFSESLKGAKHGISMETTHQDQPPHFTLQTERGPSEPGKMEGGCWERVWTGMVKHEYARPRVTAL